MKVKDPYFVLEKIEKYISEDIRPTRVRESIKLEILPAAIVILHPVSIINPVVHTGFHILPVI